VQLFLVLFSRKVQEFYAFGVYMEFIIIISCHWLCGPNDICAIWFPDYGVECFIPIKHNVQPQIAKSAKS